MSLVYTFVANKKTEDPLAKLVLFALGAYADWTTGICWPGAKTLAEDCQCSERSIRAKIEYLEKIGLVEVIPRDGRTPVLRIVGYREFYLETVQRAKKGAEKSAAPKKRGAEIHAATPEICARGAEESADELTIEQGREHISPYSPPLAEKVNFVSHRELTTPYPIENLTPSGADGRGCLTQAQSVARRVRQQSESRSVSTADWPRFYRVTHPEAFDAWVSWFEANGYAAQVFTATRGGVVWVPDANPEKGADLYRRKFPIDNHAEKCNSE